MRAHPLDVGQCRAGRSQQRMPDPQDDLTPDTEVVIEQQVVGLIDGAGRRVLHRQRAIVSCPGLYDFNDALKAPAWLCLYL